MVESCVRKLFMSTSGTSAPKRALRNSTWRTVMSRNVEAPRTGMALFGPCRPIELPSPPFSFTMATLRSSSTCSGSSAGTRASVS